MPCQNSPPLLGKNCLNKRPQLPILKRVAIFEVQRVDDKNPNNSSQLLSASKAQSTTFRGPTLIEIAVVVLIFGLLAMVAIPRAQSFKARSLQSEARAGLTSIQLAMQAHFAAQGDYPNVPQSADISTDGVAEKLGIRLPKGTGLYRFSLVSSPRQGSSEGRWAAAAVSTRPITTGVGATGHDILRLNMNRWLCSPYDGIRHQAATIAIHPRPKQARDCPESDQGYGGFVVSLTSFDVEPVLSLEDLGVNKETEPKHFAP